MTTAAKVRKQYGKYDTSLLYTVNDDITTHPYATNQELGIPDISRTTMGQSVYIPVKPVSRKTKWQKFCNFFTYNGHGKHRNRQLWG